MKNNFIKTENVEFVYRTGEEESPGFKALSGINASIEKGEFVVIIGRNGSGKSTFARLLNALLLPTDGAVYINGMDTRNESNVWNVRRTAGMVFQNPDNQIIGTTVEEDVAFGPENMGVPPEQIRVRVDEALRAVGIYALRKNAPHLLSGGQKQRVGIAGILAMKPECIILDESTAMLDPVGREEVMDTIRKLNREEGITVILITHHMNEAAESDRVIVIDKGEVVQDGSPKKVFSKVEEVKALGLDVPQVTELFHELNKDGCSLRQDVLTVEEAFEELKKAMK